ERLKPLLVNFSSLEKFTEASSANRPDFQLLDIGIATKQKLYKLEKLKLMPKAGIGAFFEIGGTTSTVSGVQATDDFNNPFNYKRAGLGFQVEGKFDFHGAAARIRKAKAEYLEVSQKRSIAKRGLNLETQQAFLNAKRQFENMQRARKAHSLARQMLFLARSNLDIGLGEKDDYLDALKRTLVSRGEYLKATFDANVATADLSRLVGQAATGELMPPMSAAEYDLINEEDSGEESWNENDTSE
ncbi:MAG: TolC family protein, partial [Deltaproteobacteria bacterium]|nr:TolC family protein [Deltaproteobacteria bacterium]